MDWIIKIRIVIKIIAFIHWSDRYFTHLSLFNSYCYNVIVAALLGIPRWHNGKESTCQCRRRRRLEFFPLVRKIPWRRKWQHIPVFLPCLKNSMDRGTWYVTVHGVTESWTRLSIWAHSTRCHDHTEGSWSELAQDTLEGIRAVYILTSRMTLCVSCTLASSIVSFSP